MNFRFPKFAVAAANLVLLWLTGKLFLGQLDWGLALGSLLLSGFWLMFVTVRLRTLFSSYFDIFSRLQVLMPLGTGLSLSCLAMFSLREPGAMAAATVEILCWLAVYALYRRNRRNYVIAGHGPLPEDSWINPAAEALQPFDLLLLSGRIATRLHESVGHGEIVLRLPDGRLAAFSSYMEQGAVLNDLSEVTANRVKHGHYIALRLKEPQGEQREIQAAAIARQMLEDNGKWRELANSRRQRFIQSLWLPASWKSKLIERFRATGYDWTGLFIGLRANNRWTCIGACLELLFRLGIKTRKYGTGLLGLGTGLLNPIMPVRFLADPAFRLLTVADKEKFESLSGKSPLTKGQERGEKTMPFKITDKELSDYLKPSKCGLRAYLRLHGEAEPDGDAYEGLLDRLTAELVVRQLAALKPATDLSQGQAEERLARTQAAMAAHDPVLYKPLLAAQATVNQTPCQLSCEPDFLVFDEQAGAYGVRLCDSSFSLEEKQLPALFARLNFSAYVLAAASGKAPARLEIVDGRGGTTKASAWEPERTGDLLKSLLSMLKRDYRPYSPVGRSKCNACPFKKSCFDAARKNQDIAILRGVDNSLVYSLRDLGIKTIPQLLERFESDLPSLAAIQRWWAGQTKPVGEKDAASILRMAKSMASGEEIVICKPAITAAKNYVMFDLEGMPERLDPAGSIYLWGLQVFGENNEPYAPALAPFEPEGDRKGWLDFLERSRDIFHRFGDIPFVHWDRYERHRLDAYIERYGDIDGIAARVKANMLDLLAVLTESMALPLSSYSLKVVEQYVGFKRTQEEFGTTWSIDIFNEASKTADPERRARLMAELLLYNREDLEATWAIQQWLATRA